MCEICHSNPCRPQCPNAEPEPAWYCEECGNAVYDGDAYYDFDGVIYCEDCMDKHRKAAEAL